ncbi:Alpha carbonic anhydrase 7, partial [Capsicum annuum]
GFNKVAWNPNSIPSGDSFLNSSYAPHMLVVIHVLRYQMFAPDQGIFLSSSLCMSLSAYVDSDWAACPSFRRSVTDFYMFWGGPLHGSCLLKLGVLTPSSLKGWGVDIGPSDKSKLKPDPDDESDFSYDENAVNGPGNWSNIHPDWIKCNTGKMQSPIDFPNKKVEVVSNLGILQKFYKPSNATLLNRGHDIMLRWDNGGFLKINGTQYQLKQVHWHTPSEHTIDGKRFDMEGHLVHETDDGKNIAVIGVLYEIGLLPDLFLKIIEKDLKALADKKDAEKAIGIIDPNLIKLDGKKYYRNMGSLTVPPCSENVVWTIDAKVKTVTRKQIKLLRDAVHDGYEFNARPVQPLNDRPIKFNKPWPFI